MAYTNVSENSKIEASVIAEEDSKTSREHHIEHLAASSITMIDEHVESSLCCAPVSNVLIYPSSKICDAKAKKNILVAQQDTQLRSLLLELMYRKIIPLEEACCYYHSSIRDTSNL